MAGPTNAAGRDLQRVLLSYTLRQKLYQTASSKCTDWLARRNDPQLQYWKFCALGFAGSISEAIRGLQQLQTRRETEYPSMCALLHFHRKASMVDRESIEALEASLPSALSAATDSSSLLAANFRVMTGEYAEAAQLTERLVVPNGVPQTPLQHQAHVLMAWTELLREIQPSQKGGGSRALKLMERVNEGLELDVLLARAYYYDLYHQQQSALDCLNQAVALQPTFFPALLEKAKILISMGDWDMGHETILRVLNLDADNVEALRLLALHTIAREANSRHAVDSLQSLNRAMEKQEGRNAEFLYQTSRLFSRLVGRRNREALQLTTSMMERACKVAPDVSEYATEAGYQSLLVGDTVSAMNSFRQASRLDQSNVRALHGMIRCQINNHQLEDAEQQMEFLGVIHESLGPSAEPLYLQAVLVWRRSHDRSSQISLLDRALDLHYQAYRDSFRAGSCHLLRRFVISDPDFLMEVALEYLLHVSQVSTRPGEMTDKSAFHAVKKGIEVLEKLVVTMPGHLSAHLEIARAHLAMGEHEQAQRLLNEAMRLDPTSSEVQLLLARVAIASEDYKGACTALEQALSNDFAIRSSPVYHLLRAQTLSNQGSQEEALEQLEEAIKLPSMNDSRMDDGLVTLADKVSIYLEMVAVLSKLGRIQEASAAVKQVQELARGTMEEFRVLIANAELAIKRNELEKALRMLGSVSKDSPGYIPTMVYKANVYLTHRHDRRGFAQCYLDLVQNLPTPSAYILLGDAYMSIQAPESAIEAFQTALDLNPGDKELAIKIGRALVSTHDYRKAIDYYETALRQNPTNRALRQDLAKLYTKLGKHTLAIGILEYGTEKMGATDDLPTASSNVQNLLLLTETYAASGERAEALDTLTRGWNLQRAVLEKTRMERSDQLPEQKRVAADICFRMGKLYESGEKDEEKAIECYRDAVRIDEVFEPALLALARIFKRKGQLEDCEKLCLTLLRVNSKDAEHASMLLGDVAFLKGDYDLATLNYRQLLERKPNNYHALSKLITLLRGAGKLEEAEAFLNKAAKEDPRSASHQGYSFCQGLYYRYTNNISEAIKWFNQARKDGEWAARSLENMIEVYVDPEGELLTEEDISANGDDNSSNASKDNQGPSATNENLKVAEKLLQELGRVTTDQRRLAVLQNYQLLASKARSNIDKASQGFIELLEADKDYLPALLGMSIAFILKHQPEKARNTLRMISKLPYNHDMAEELERSYLLLAELYVVKAKFDLAQDFCRKCLGHNKSCGPAWELLGRIMEKEQSYKDAADCYEKAWQLEHEASASIGFKLAFNYLKDKRHVEAVDICHKVLKQFPDYPRIREEILQKAQSALRPTLNGPN